MICPNVNVTNFVCKAPKDPLHQRVFTYLQLGSSGIKDSVSTAGSEWGRGAGSSLVLSQSDYWVETIASALGLSDTASGSMDRPASVADSLGILDSFIWTGTADDGSGGGSGPTEIEATFDSDTKKGMVVYITGVGHAELAKADSQTTALAIGLAYEDVAAAATGKYLTEGQVEKTDWADVTGSATLTPGAIYFLSKDTAGFLTTTAPSTAGESVTRVGLALSTTTLDVEIDRPILLSGNTSTGGDINYFIDATAGNQTVSLDPAADMDGQKVYIKKVDSTSNTVTIDADGAETIDGQPTQTLTLQYTSITIASDGTEWWIV